MSLKEEISSLKSDLSSLQNLFKEKFVSMEVRISEIENKISRTSAAAAAAAAAAADAVGLANAEESGLHDYANRGESVAKVSVHERTFNVTSSSINTLTNQDVDNRTRNIIEALMWESTLSEAVLHVRETFKENNSREKFLRCSIELVLEKDEQYRKMLGTLYGHLISQNIVTPTNVYNSLSSVLLVIESSNNYDNQMWPKLTDILLPVIADSHIKLLQLQRTARTILKHDYYSEFVNHLENAVEANRTKTKPSRSKGKAEYFQQHSNASLDADREFKAEEQPAALDIPNIYDIDDLTRYKPSAVLDACLDVVEHQPVLRTTPPRCDVQNMLHNLSSDSLDETVAQLKRLNAADLQTAVEEMIDCGIRREHEQRMTIGTLLALCVSQHVADTRQLLTSFCKSVYKVERLILNQKTRSGVCEAFADIVCPLLSNDRVKFENLNAMATLTLPEETKTIFLWSVEKILRAKGVRTEARPSSPKAIGSRMLQRFVKYMGAGRSRLDDDAGEGTSGGGVGGVGGGLVPQDKGRHVVPEATYEKSGQQTGQQDKAAVKDKFDDEKSEHDKYLSLKRRKLLKERAENIGDRMDGPPTDEQTKNEPKKGGEGESGAAAAAAAAATVDVPSKGVETSVPKPSEIVPTSAVSRQLENLPSSIIKEKVEDIIETLISSGAGNMDECVNMIKDTFNECQTDLVFKAAFEYTKEKTPVYRIQCGQLISEAYKHDAKRIGAQIMNILSLELGDYEDTPELWNGMAEILSPTIVNGLIRFSDLKLLPKYFLHTNHCGSLLLATIKQILQLKGPTWLEDNWKKSKVDFSMFLPLNMCYSFIIENNLQYCLKQEELQYFKENDHHAG